MRRSTLLLLGWSTLIGFSGIGIALAWFVDGRTVHDIFQSRFPIITQILFGALTGWILGYLAWLYVSMKHMDPVHTKYSDIFGNLRLKMRDVWFISLCAGVGEEILFRGAIQHWLGIWITSVIFIAIHGYLNPMSWRISSYGVLMTAMIALLGWQSDYFGILTSISAHMMIDVLLLSKLSHTNEPNLNNFHKENSTDITNYNTDEYTTISTSQENEKIT